MEGLVDVAARAVCSHHEANRGTCPCHFFRFCCFSFEEKFLGRQFNLDIALVCSYTDLFSSDTEDFARCLEIAFVFVIESFVLALIPSVRCNSILVLNPIIVFTAPDLEIILENKTSARPRLCRTLPLQW